MISPVYGLSQKKDEKNLKDDDLTEKNQTEKLEELGIICNSVTD